MANTDPLWTIDELGELVAGALSVDYAGQANGQVRDVPDRRTIRYYTTLGLIDRPAEMRGRTALYGRRHLLQLVAIKRLQAAGRSLAEIQQRLLGLANAALIPLARLPADVEALAAGLPQPDAQRNAAPDRDAEGFWKAAPAPPPVPPPPPAVSEPLHGIRLSDDVTLLLGLRRPLDSDDMAALRDVAAELVQILESRRLIRPRHQRGTP